MENLNTDPENDDRTLEEKSEDIAQEAKVRISSLDKDFNEKLDDIGKRVQTARSRADQFKPEANNFSGMNSEDAKGLGTGLSAAYSLIGTPVACYVIGIAIDRSTGRTPDQVQFAPFFGFFGFVLGLFFTIIIANRHNK